MTDEPNCSCLQHAEPNTCAACRFGFCRYCTYPQAIQCRRRSPVALGEPMARGLWPNVDRGAWCGDFEKREIVNENGTLAPCGKP